MAGESFIGDKRGPAGGAAEDLHEVEEAGGDGGGLNKVDKRWGDPPEDEQRPDPPQAGAEQSERPPHGGVDSAPGCVTEPPHQDKGGGDSGRGGGGGIHRPSAAHRHAGEEAATARGEQGGVTRAEGCEDREEYPRGDECGVSLGADRPESGEDAWAEGKGHGGEQARRGAEPEPPGKQQHAGTAQDQ